MSYADYHARDWATGRSAETIQEEIDRCEARYLKPYLWNSTENAQNTIERINSLNAVLVEMKAEGRITAPFPEWIAP